MEMTVRQCIEKMRKVRSSIIFLRNGTQIDIFEINASKEDHIGTIKWNPDGSVRVLRRIFCRIYPDSRTKGLDELKKNRDWYLFDEKMAANDEYQYFNKNEFVIPERKMNEFISDNGEIDVYRTIDEPGYMMDDTIALLNEMEESYND